MAISSYGKALASMAKESVMGSAKGFGSSIKSAVLSEMPGFTGAADFARSLRKEAEKYQKETEKSNDEVKDEVKKQVREQKVTNTLTSQMTGLLKSISENTLIQTRFMSQQSRLDRQNRMFAEENEREKNLRDNALLKAIKDIGKNLNFGKKPGTTESDGGSGLGARLLTSIVGGAIGSLLGKKIVVVLSALAAGVKSILAAIAALAAKIGLSSLGGLGRGTPIPGKRPSARTRSRIPKGQPGTGRSTKAPVRGAGLRAGMGLAGAALRTNPFTFALGAGLLLPEVLEMMGYDPYGAMSDFFFPPAQGATNQKSSTSSTNSIPKRPGAEDVGPNMSLQAVKEARRKWDRTYGRTHNPDGTPKSVTKGSFIRAKEGVRLNAYADTSRGYSVGYGHFITSNEIKQGFIDLGDGEKVNVFGEKGKNTKLTAEQAEKLFQKDLKIREKDIVRILGNENYNKLNEHQKEALRSYYYNVGKLPPGFVQAIATNDFINAQESFRKGVATAEGVRNQGLVDRRNAEALLFSIGGTPGSRRGPNFGARRSNSNFIVPSSNVSGSGSAVATELTVPVEDKAVAEKIDVQTKAIKNIESSSRQNLVETRRQNENLIPTKRQETRNQRIAREANERFLAGFQALTTTKITNAIEKALFPKGYGVTAAQASADRYRGDALGDLFKTQRFFNRTFGKEYGPLFDQLSRSYLEIGASNVGDMLFGGTAGVDARALTGQILGNIRQGRKDVALEQLLYGMTGTSSGYETLFAKYGFGSAQQGVQTMGNIFGAGATDIVRRNAPFMGEVPGETKYYDPITKQQVTYGGLMQSPFGTVKVGGLNAQAVFVTNDKQPGVSASAAASGAGRSVTFGDPSQIYGYGYGEELVQATDKTNKTLENYHDDHLAYMVSYHDDDKAWTQNSDKIVQQGAAAGVGATMAAAQATGNVFTRGIEWLGNIFTSSAGRGGGTNISFGGGGGTFGNFLMDLGKTAAISRLTRNMSNPYAKAIANFGLNRAADVGIQTIMKGGNIGDVLSGLSTAFNLPNTINTISNLPTTISNFFSGTSSVGVPTGMPGINMLADGTLLAAPTTAASSLTTGANAFTYYGAPAATAASSLTTGTAGYTYYGASAAPAAAGSTLGSTLTALASNPATWIILGAFLLMGSKKKAPTAVHKVIVIAGNSNIDAKSTVFTRYDPPKAYYDAADQFLNVAFNTTKMLEIKTGKRAPFDYVYMRVESDRVEIDYGEGAFKPHLKSTGPLEGKRLGGGIQTVNIAGVAKQIAEHIGEKFKTADSDGTEKIEKGVDELLKKPFKSITSGIEAEIARDIDLASSSRESDETFRQIQAGAMLTQFQAPRMETFFSGEGEEFTGERLIYDFRTGKMVKQSETGFGVTKGKKTIIDSEGFSQEVETTTYDEKIIGINKEGKPIYNVGDSAINAEDMLQTIGDVSTSMAAGTVIAPLEPPPPPVNYFEQITKGIRETVERLTEQNEKTDEQTDTLDDQTDVIQTGVEATRESGDKISGAVRRALARLGTGAAAAVVPPPGGGNTTINVGKKDDFVGPINPNMNDAGAGGLFRGNTSRGSYYTNDGVPLNIEREMNGEYYITHGNPGDPREYFEIGPFKTFADAINYASRGGKTIVAGDSHREDIMLGIVPYKGDGSYWTQEEIDRYLQEDFDAMSEARKGEKSHFRLGVDTYWWTEDPYVVKPGMTEDEIKGVEAANRLHRENVLGSNLVFPNTQAAIPGSTTRTDQAWINKFRHIKSPIGVLDHFLQALPAQRQVSTDVPKYTSPDKITATAVEFRKMGYVWSSKLQTYVDRHDLDDIESRYEVDPDRPGYGYIVTPQRNISDRLFYSSGQPGEIAQEVTGTGTSLAITPVTNTTGATIFNATPTNALKQFLAAGQNPQTLVTPVNFVTTNQNQTSSITINASSISDADPHRIGGSAMAITAT